MTTGALMALSSGVFPVKEPFRGAVKRPGVFHFSGHLCRQGGTASLSGTALGIAAKRTGRWWACRPRPSPQRPLCSNGSDAGSPSSAGHRENFTDGLKATYMPLRIPVREKCGSEKKHPPLKLGVHKFKKKKELVGVRKKGGQRCTFLVHAHTHDGRGIKDSTNISPCPPGTAALRHTHPSGSKRCYSTRAGPQQSRFFIGKHSQATWT